MSPLPRIVRREAAQQAQDLMPLGQVADASILQLRDHRSVSH